MLGLLGHGDGPGIVQVTEIAPQVFGKTVDQLSGSGGVFFAKIFNAAQGIVDKMGTDLTHHR